MNKTAILFLLSSLLIFVSSCSKNALDQPGINGLRCAIGSSEYVADSAYYTKSLGTSIVAQKGATTQFKFFLTTADTVGTFVLDSVINKAYYTDGVTTYRSISGSVYISQYYNDSLKMISGSFDFVGRVPGSSGNTINISYGYFNNIPKH